MLARTASPARRTQLIGWLAMLSCAPLICSLLRPPVWVLVPLWALAGAAGTYQLATAAAFTQTLRGAARARAFGVAQSGLLVAQGLGIVVAGMAASTLGPQRVVGIAGLLGVSAAAILAARWAGHAEHADHNAHTGHADQA